MEPDTDIVARHRGQLAPIAVAQLEAWQAFSKSWLVHLAQREINQRLDLVCDACGMTIIAMNDGKYPYVIPAGTIQDMTVDHLRRVHLDQERNAYEIAGL